MARMVRLVKGSIPAEQVGVAISPSDFTTGTSQDDPSKTWEEDGYKLDSYEDDHTPYQLTDADKSRVADAKEKRAAARAEKAAEPAPEPAKGEPAKAKKD